MSAKATRNLTSLCNPPRLPTVVIDTLVNGELEIGDNGLATFLS